MIKIIFSFLLISFSFSPSYSKDLKILGLNKLSLEDIQVLSNVDLDKNDFTENEINNLLNKLYSSDLIYDVELNVTKKEYQLTLKENKIIQNIYFNNNIWLDDESLFNFIISKNEKLLSKDTIQQDIKSINSIYKSRGFFEVSTVAKVESFSDDRINLIFEIYEGNQSKLNYIDFVGNKQFSDKFLSSKINSQSLKFYNFFKSGSNFNPDIFSFDRNKLINFYIENGFFDVDVSYEINKNNFGAYSLTFFIKESIRYKIDKIDFEQLFENIPSFNKLYDNLILDLNKNKNYYSKNLITEFLETLNLSLIRNNINDYYVDIEVNLSGSKVFLKLKKVTQNPYIIKHINIFGNSITKDKTIRSKLLIEPGDTYNKYLVNRSITNLEKFSYIKNVKIDNNLQDNTTLDLTIDESKKTGNVLFAGTFNTDTQFGLTFGIEDKNFFGSGNIVDANFDINSENLRFNINYTEFPLSNPYLSNTYTIFNQENDLESSFGYSQSKKGLGYKVNFSQNDQLNLGFGFSFINARGHSPKNSSITAITDNIGTFNNINFTLNAINDKTDSVINPSDGHYNSLTFIISPSGISDDPFYKLIYQNKNYFNLKDSSNYIFFNNNIGYSESFSSKLKTNNSFSLGGNNFKGFDFRGIGPKVDGIYVGGNQYITSTLGYGISFIFDEKDNVNIKLFTTAGSLWGSDYSNNQFELRATAGISLDFITAIGPISFSYALPLQKSDNDIERPFSFTIGSSF